MSIITTFYSDEEKTNALYPITKTKAIYDDNNVNLEQRLNNIKTEIQGINGFSGVDMNNVLLACGSGTEFDYTTTDDCFYWATAITNNVPFEFDGMAIEKQSFAIGSFPLKKGTHIKGKTGQGYLRIYGLK